GGTVGSDIKVWRDISQGGSDADLDRDIRDALQFVKAKFL
ncbi:MAG: dolichol monophosphate mannose synthase, partial [Planctomycetes bacterium]|nr:dolichol monophosphate mannose synthase [Planctomycetota bacterium]